MVENKLSRLAEIIKDNAFLVDVRSTEEFSFGSAEGAINIPLFSVPLRLDEFKNKENIVVFCESGGRSAQAKMILEEHGIKGVTNGGGWIGVAQACRELK